MLRALRHELRLLAVALQFLTRLPVRAPAPWQPQWLSDCVRHFPAIGLLVGSIGALVLLGALTLWPPSVAALLALGATVLLTGAFHEDGLADTADALGGLVSRERALAIMKDSRIGSYGAVALVLVLGLRVALAAALVTHAPILAAATLALGHMVSRCAAVAVMAALPYAGDADHAKAKPLAQGVGWGSVAGALAWCALAAAAGLAWQPVAWRAWLAGALACAATAALMLAWLHKRLGGYTGDTLGASEEAAQIAWWLAVTAVAL